AQPVRTGAAAGGAGERRGRAPRRGRRHRRRLLPGPRYRRAGRHLRRAGPPRTRRARGRTAAAARRALPLAAGGGATAGAHGRGAARPAQEDSMSLGALHFLRPAWLLLLLALPLLVWAWRRLSGARG